MSLPIDSPRVNRGPSTFDQRHQFVLHGISKIPSPSGRGWRAVFGGWQASWIYTHVTGSPFSALLGYDAARTRTIWTGGVAGQRPDLAPAAGSNPVTGDPLRWFDPSAFVRPVEGFLGNVGRNTLRGPGLDNLDAALVRQIALPGINEAARLDLRAEFFNTLNHTNFDLPTERRMQVFNRDSAPDDVGRIASAGPSREIQVGLKLVF